MEDENGPQQTVDFQKDREKVMQDISKYKDLCKKVLFKISNPIFQRSLDSLSRGVNWMLVISAGALIWSISYYDKIKIDIPLIKINYINFTLNTNDIYKLAIFFLVSSTIILSIFQALLYYMTFKRDKALDIYQAECISFVDTLEDIESIMEDPTPEKMELIPDLVIAVDNRSKQIKLHYQDIKKPFFHWIKPLYSTKIVKYALYFYLIGIMLLSIYLYIWIRGI